MERYKNFVKIEEIRELLRQGKNEEALELADGMDSSKIKDNFDRSVLAQVYLHNGMLNRAKDCFILMYEKRKTRRVAMELVNLSIRLKQADDAEKYYEEYKALAPNDYYNLIFRYKIDRLKNRPLTELAASLEKLREIEFFDNWGYELAKVYHKLGDEGKCVEICDEVILWFGDGEYVERAKALKAYYAGELTLKQMSEKTKAESERSIEAAPNTDIVVSRPEGKTKQGQDTTEQEGNLAETRVAPGGWITKEALEAAEEEKRKAAADAEMSEADAEKPEAEEEPEAEAGKPEEDMDGLSDGASKETEIADGAGQVWDGDSEFIIGGETAGGEDNFEEEIVKAVEEALKEETDRVNQTFYDNAAADKAPAEDTVLREKVSETVQDDGQKENTVLEIENPENTDSQNNVDEDSINSALMAAVEEELGFIENSSHEPEDRKSRKKKHRDKKQERREREEQAALLRKQREEQKLQEQKQHDEELKLQEQRKRDEEEEAIRQAELRRAKQEAADAAARRAREKMGMDNSVSRNLAGMVDEIIEEDKQEKQAEESSLKGSDIHKQKKLTQVEPPSGSRLAEILEKDSSSLEEYFGFFAYRQDICSQLFAGLEALLGNENKSMNYCIIGEKGAGKKVIIQGITRLLYRAGRLETKQAVWTDASKLNGTKLSLLTAKLSGRCLVIERAGGISEMTVEDLLSGKKHYAGHTSVVLTDYRKNLMDLLKDDRLNEMFSIRLNLPTFSRDNLIELAEYKASKADYVFSNAAYELLEKRITCISRATEEGAMARAEKYIMKILDNVEQRNAKEFIKQTMQGGDHVRSNVIEPSDLPEDI